MSRERRREMVDREHPALSTLRQCALMGISRSSVYYRPRAPSQKDLALMKQIDQQYLATPFYGSRRMKVWLDRQGHRVNRKRIQRLMRAMPAWWVRRHSGWMRCRMPVFWPQWRQVPVRDWASLLRGI